MLLCGGILGFSLIDLVVVGKGNICAPLWWNIRFFFGILMVLGMFMTIPRQPLTNKLKIQYKAYNHTDSTQKQTINTNTRQTPDHQMRELYYPAEATKWQLVLTTLVLLFLLLMQSVMDAKWN